MAKLRTKRTVMDTTVTEVDGKPGVWWWEVGAMTWRWQLTRGGLNLEMMNTNDPDRGFVGMIYAEKLEHGVMFSWGVHAGKSMK